MTFHAPGTPPPIAEHNFQAWSSKTSDGNNSDVWMVLLDSGKLEIHAGTPFVDGGALYSSKLLANKALEFEKTH